jgi:microsomal epoxide hydrolase
MSLVPFTVPEHADEARWVRERVAAFRFFEEPQLPGGAGWAYGANRAYMERLRAHWLEHYDWSAKVAELNRQPHFRAAVDGTTLHLVHKRSSRPDAIPLLIAHGWPSTVYEFWRVLDALAEPDDPALTAFHVVAPSLPGYGWSDKPAAPIGPRRIAALYDQLMTQVLGYPRYLAQGGDWGSLVTAWAALDSPAVAALHLNGYGLRGADMTPTTSDELAWLKAAKAVRDRETGYLVLQATKPQSLGFAMMDSPMGVAAWLAEKYCAWSDVGPAGDPPFSLDDVLTEVMITLTTRTFATSTWLYRGFFEEGSNTVPKGRRIEVPVGVANFPHDLLRFPPRSMVERAYAVSHWTDMPRGGHFAAWEEPALFVADLRAFTGSLHAKGVF